MKTKNMKGGTAVYKFILFLLSLLIFSGVFASCASRGAIQAEEFFSIGMAYYEMGKFAEAEKWLNRASAMDRTMSASDYNLGRIAFEAGRYTDALRYFNRILDKDPDNVLALKAAAYTHIKNGDLQQATKLYDRILTLIPESADDGFNYALVLYGQEKYPECETILNKYPIALEENAASILLLARAQKAQNKVEAVDTYAKWLIVNTGTANPQALYEYAQVLESSGFYARALEQYKEALTALEKDTAELTKSKLRFEQARLLLAVDPANTEGITVLNTAVDEGFKDIDAIEKLLKDERISQINRDEIKRIVDGILSKTTKEPGSEEKSAAEEKSGDTESKSEEKEPA